MKRNKLTKQQKLRKEHQPERWVLGHSARIRNWSLTRKKFHWPAYVFLEEKQWREYIMRGRVKYGL